MTETREEILAGKDHDKMMEDLRDMDIKTKWEMIDHSTIRTKTLSDYLDGIIEDNPKIFWEWKI